MAEVKKILAEFIDTTEKYNKPYLKYRQPEGTQPDRVWEHELSDEMSDDALLKVAEANAGERFCVHQGSNEKGYPILVNVTDASDAPKKTYQKSQYGGKGGGGWAKKDETGVAVGAAYKDVKENMTLLEEQPVFATMDEVREFVKQEARKVLKDKQELEDEVRAAKKAKEGDKKEGEEKPKSRFEQMKEKKAAEAAGKKTTTKAKPKKEPEPEPELEDDEDIDFGGEV